MRIESHLGPPTLSGRAVTAPIAFACALVLVMVGPACLAHAAVAQAALPAVAQLAQQPRAGVPSAGAFERDGGSHRAAVALEEQSLPPAELASPTPSPAASPDAAASSSAPPFAAAPPSAPDGTGGDGWTRVPATAGGAPASGAATGAPAEAAGAPVAGEPSPAGTPTEEPPPYDVGSIQPTQPVSDQPLTGLIAATKDQPALNASLHITEQGREELEASKLDDAIRDFGRAISIDPTNPYAYFYLGRTYMQKKDYLQALAFFGRSEVGVRAVPAWLGEVKSFEGACLEEQGKFPEAAAAYKEALDVAPGNLMARTGYGRLSESLSDANAGNAPPPPAPGDGAALPAPEVNLAAPAPSEAPPPSAGSDQPSSSADPSADSDDNSGADSNTDSGDDSGSDATDQTDAPGGQGSPGGRNEGAGAQGVH